jgi:hypothetical protein
VSSQPSLAGVERPDDVWCRKPNSTEPDRSADVWPTILPPFAPIAGYVTLFAAIPALV